MDNRQSGESQPPPEYTTSHNASPAVEGAATAEPERTSADTDRTLVPGAINEEDLYSGWKLAILMVSLCFGNFLGGMDFTVTATAIPIITSYFNSLDDVGWYGAAYYMAFTVGQPLAGKLFTFYPKKIVYLCYVGIFAIGSLVCALAPTSVALIVGRAVSGLGASGMVAGCLAIIATVAPLRKRPMLTGLTNSSFGGAQIVGPLIGGALAEKVSWRWCFYINLPITGVAAALLLFILSLKTAETERQPPLQKIKNLDFPGFCLLAGSVIMLLIALEWGGSEYSWGSSVIIGLFVGFGVTFAVFVAWQWYLGDNGLLPTRLFKNRTAALAVAASFVGDGGFQAICFYLPIWFQGVLGVSPISSGIRYLPSVLSDVLTSIIGGGLVMTIGTYKPFHLFGACCLSIGGGLLSTLYPTINEGRWIGYQILCGVGFSFLVTMPHVAVQSVLPPDLIPIASSTIMFGMVFGCSVCVAVAQTIFSNRLRHNLLEVVTPSQAAQIIHAGASKVQDVIREDHLNATAVDNAYSHAITDTFYIPAAGAACAFFLVLGMQWTNLKHKKPATELRASSDMDMTSSPPESEPQPEPKEEKEAPETFAQRFSRIRKSLIK